MKEICVKRSTFNKVIGYGSWGLITFTLIFMLILNSIEIKNFHEEEIKLFDNVSKIVYCYETILTKETRCGHDESSMINIVLLIMNGLNIFGIGIWIYYKQTKFKFAWCKTTSEKGETHA